jgi:mannose-1-phosphate guanylyltransferase
MPKQFQKFTSSRTMIQETYKRVSGVVPLSNIMVSTTEKYAKLVLKQLPKLEKSKLIIEPVPRGTAPAIALVAQHIKKINPQAVIATIASDHAIKNTEEFTASIGAALETAQKNPDKLVIIGINPTFPDTGLGYIKMGKEFSKVGKKKVFYVSAFKEKPDLKTAEKYLREWEYLWNAGYFIFSAQGFLKITKRLMPKTFRALEVIYSPAGAKKTKKLYESLKNEPIDTAVAEKLDANQRLVVPSAMEWSDVGNWGALFDFFRSDKNKTPIIVRGKHIDEGSQDCLVHVQDKLLATVGLKDIIIVETKDAILVANRKKAAEVKKIIEKLKDQKKHSYL